MKKIYLSIALLFLGAGITMPLSVHALQVQPMILDEISLNPGESAKKVVKLTNESNASITYRAAFYEAEPSSDEGGQAKYSARTTESTLANWMVVEPSEITLQPGRSQVVDVRIITPQDAAPGSHLALVGWGTVGTTITENGATLQGMTGVNVAVNISGATVEKANIVSFATEGDQTKYERLPITFVARINNAGNRHFKPQGAIAIKDAFGRVVASLPFNETNAGGNVLPGATRQFATTWTEGFAFGKYTAALDTSLGKSDTGSASFSFWVLPTGLLVLWLIIAVVIIAILIMLIKNMMTSMKK